MFAVTGWSLSSSDLKTQILESSQKVGKECQTSDGSTGKRKRGHSIPNSSKVNSTNFLDLWDKVIEGKGQKESLAPTKKCRRGRRLRTSVHSTYKENKPVVAAKQLLIHKPTKHNDETSATKPTARKPIEIAQNSIENAELTPLQISMRQKLVSARFRHINETLYTTPSTDSFELFQQNPEMFQDYHEGFRQQVRIWPENPVNSYIAQIQARGMLHGQAYGQDSALRHNEGNELAWKALPLPRTGGICHIADLGCGDAALSLALDSVRKNLGLQVFSYDLQGSNPLITEADIANLPLEDGSIDVAIFCLALMGTNWTDFVEEAFRVLRWRGELWVAEIKSRFGKVSAKGKGVEHSVGNWSKSRKAEIKRVNEDVAAADPLLQIDGHNENKVETDVSAFVEVLSKRGFILQNERAVDLSNKMFVTLNFFKGQTPEGKCTSVPRAMTAIGQQTRKRKLKARFLEDKALPLGESGVLRPCVYKVR